jgi:hypothetical protein
MLVGEHGGDPMVPRSAMMKALQGREPKMASAPRRKCVDGKFNVTCAACARNILSDEPANVG